MTEEKQNEEKEEIKKPNLTIAGIKAMLQVAKQYSLILDCSSLLKAEGAFVCNFPFAENNRVHLWSGSPFDDHKPCAAVYPQLNKDGGLQLLKVCADMHRDDIVVCPALSASDTAALKNTFSFNDKMKEYVTLYECMDEEPVDKSSIEKSELKPTGKTYPICNQDRIIQIPELEARQDGKKYALYKNQYYPIVNAKGVFTQNDDGQEIFVFTNVRMCAPMEFGSVVFDSLQGKYMEIVVLRAISFGLLPTKDWLREKEKEKSQNKESIRQSVGLWATLGKLASSMKTGIRRRWHQLLADDVIVGDINGREKS